MAITITVDDVKKAKNYMPLYHKYAIAGLMAKLCVRIERVAGESGDLPVPDRCVEDRAMRQQCLVGVLAGWYFGKEYRLAELTVESGEESKPVPINLCMDAADADEWLGSHVFNQLERLKKDKLAANKVYDILADYRVFENFLNGAIREEMDARNDPALRMAQMIAMQGSPESMKEVVEMLREMEGGGKEDGNG